MRRKLTEQQIERERIEWVFGLTGGELDTDPSFKDADGKVVYAYSYDGYPEWASSDFTRDGTYATGIVTGGGFLPNPVAEISAKSGKWVLERTYAHSGETRCPLADWNNETRTDEQNRKVTRFDAHLVNRYPKGKRAECPYCEARIGEEHGYIYVGESYEAVYRFVPAAPIHRSDVGTYHPNPKAEVAWTINDTRGYMDGGPSCDECDACECMCPECRAEGGDAHECEHSDRDDFECVGLSFAYVCLDGGDALCKACAEKEGIKVEPCDCP